MITFSSFLPYEVLSNLRAVSESDIVFISSKHPVKYHRRKSMWESCAEALKEKVHIWVGPGMPQMGAVIPQTPTEPTRTSPGSLNMPQSQPLEGAEVQCLVFTEEGVLRTSKEALLCPVLGPLACTQRSQGSLPKMEGCLALPASCSVLTSFISWWKVSFRFNTFQQSGGHWELGVTRKKLYELLAWFWMFFVLQTLSFLFKCLREYHCWTQGTCRLLTNRSL